MAVLLIVARSVPEKHLPSGACFPLCRNPDAREEPSAFAREQLEAAAVRAHHALDDGEAQARTALVAARDFEPGKRLLQALHFRRGNARAAVRDLEHRGAVLGAHRNAYVALPIAQRVVDEVLHHAPHRQRLQRQPGHAGELGRDRLAAAVGVLGAPGPDPGEIAALQGFSPAPSPQIYATFYVL